MDVLQNLPPLVTLVLGVLLVVWLVLFLLVPFMLESIRSGSRRSAHELAEINRKLDRLIALLDERGGEPPVLHDVRDPRIRATPAPPPGEPRADRVRKEPTISG